MPLTEWEFLNGLPQKFRTKEKTVECQTMTPRELGLILAFLTECDGSYRYRPSPERLFALNVQNGERIPAVVLQILAPVNLDA